MQPGREDWCKAAAGGPGEVADGRLGGLTFACRQTRRNNRGARQTTQPRAPTQGNKASALLIENTCGD